MEIADDENVHALMHAIGTALSPKEALPALGQLLVSALNNKTGRDNLLVCDVLYSSVTTFLYLSLDLTVLSAATLITTTLILSRVQTISCCLSP